MEHGASSRNAHNMAVAAFIFSLVAAVFSALIYFTLPAMTQRGVENVEAMKVGGHEKYEELKQVYMDNAEIFAEQVDQIKSQIEMYKQMQAQGGDAAGIMPEQTGDEKMPADDMMMTGDEAAAQ